MDFNIIELKFIKAKVFLFNLDMNETKQDLEETHQIDKTNTIAS
jgi:hypothetical protein